MDLDVLWAAMGRLGGRVAWGIMTGQWLKWPRGPKGW